LRELAFHVPTTRKIDPLQLWLPDDPFRLIENQADRFVGSKPISSATLVLWGSIGSMALVEAYDAEGKVVDLASREKVPERTGPEQPIPSFELTVKAPAIASLRFSGSQPGGYLVCDELRFTPQ
jgi:hypothetical protein